ncbi:hypothetical protein ABI_22860 [Asticcacaulis biprosthecium C19]|uniref:Uncharacterized protein n=1 Tax=Asticcacaulis biprosthecium C19 TaxID=715226 RepID=F4QNG6_9CAUL|nr:hypothetical protein ABI_22860 [Asticcacaulis biprosthecium C19]
MKRRIGPERTQIAQNSLNTRRRSRRHRGQGVRADDLLPLRIGYRRAWRVHLGQGGAIGPLRRAARGIAGRVGIQSRHLLGFAGIAQPQGQFELLGHLPRIVGEQRPALDVLRVAVLSPGTRRISAQCVGGITIQAGQLTDPPWVGALGQRQAEIGLIVGAIDIGVVPRQVFLDVETTHQPV